jgi:hypothetical protein
MAYSLLNRVYGSRLRLLPYGAMAVALAQIVLRRKKAAAIFQPKDSLQRTLNTAHLTALESIR